MGLKGSMTGEKSTPLATGVKRPRNQGGPGVCWQYNAGQCAHGQACKFLHACGNCRGPHPCVRCARAAVTAWTGKPLQALHSDILVMHATRVMHSYTEKKACNYFWHSCMLAIKPLNSIHMHVYTHFSSLSQDLNIIS